MYENRLSPCPDRQPAMAEIPICTGKILESVPHIAAKGEFDMVDTRGYICPPGADGAEGLEGSARHGGSPGGGRRSGGEHHPLRPLPGYQSARRRRTGLETDPDEIKDRRGARRLPACRFPVPRFEVRMSPAFLWPPRSGGRALESVREAAHLVDDAQGHRLLAVDHAAHVRGHVVLFSIRAWNF